MTKQLLLLFIVFLPLCSAAQKDSQEIKDFTKQLDQRIPELLNDFNVPGAALAIIENGEIILQKGYGYSDVSKKTKVSTTTGFNIGSISKTVAAWGVMKLVQEGKIDLDAPAEKYLTRWHLPESEFDADGVTIRRLLSHTAGLSLHGYPGWSPKDELPTIEESLNGKNNGPGRVEIIMEPGTKWKYSGGGFSILQLIVEEVTGQKFEDYMQKEILNPLGMTNSSYTISDKIMKASSQEHNNFGEVIDFELFTAQAAAGLHTTIEEFTKFAQASLHASKSNKKHQKILTAVTLQEMMEAAPASNGSYGLGYQIQSIPGTSITLRGHGGANSGWHAFLRVDPVSNDGFIMITNGGAGYNIYTKAFCDWIFWKTGQSMGNRCNVLPSISTRLKQIIDSQGTENLKNSYSELKRTESDAYNFSEDELNQLGYHYLGNNKTKEALAVFKINVEIFPSSSNVYDSYGEALLKNDEKENAIENYKKSIELNPGNTGGINVLKKLGVDTATLTKKITVDDKILQSYVGIYELAPEFKITIFKEGNQLKGQPTGQGVYEIYPKSDNEFYLTAVDAQIVFNRDSTGEVESLTLHQGGQKMTGQRLKD